MASSTVYKRKLDFTEKDLVTDYDRPLKYSHLSIGNFETNCQTNSKTSSRKLNHFDFKVIIDKIQNCTIKPLENNADKYFPPGFCEKCVNEKRESRINKKKFVTIKLGLVSTVFHSLLGSLPYTKILELIESDFKNDPEFILKLALYCRKELNIRTVSNELFALSANSKYTKYYMKKYFDSMVNTPNDWVEIAYLYMEIFQTTKLPNQLRKIMIEKFQQFSIYQLGKYENKSKKIEINGKTVVLKLKSLIRILHISEPAKEVLCIIGKKYPMDVEEFRKTKMSGHFESELAGKRMKLPIPETWETQLSMHGNNKEVWIKLIVNKSLPYMAMIRNIRNIIYSGVDMKYHTIVINSISLEASVLKGKMLPFQYFTAYSIVDEINNECTNSSNTKANSSKAKNKHIKKKKPTKVVDTKLVSQYKKSLDKAVSISSRYNIPPIRGKMLVLANLQDSTMSQSKFGFVKKRDEVTSLMISLFYLASEYVETFAIHKDLKLYELQVPNGSNSILLLSKVLLEMGKHKLSKFRNLNDVLINMVENLIHFDTIVIIGEIIENGWLENYVNHVNNNVNIYRIFHGKNEAYDAGELPNTTNMHGLNEQMVKFISEQSNGGILDVIDRIDRKYNLADNIDYELVCDLGEDYTDISMVSTEVKEKQNSFTIFVSSTFVDLEEERNYFNSIMMPKLRSKLKAYNSSLHLNWIDLRWGIPSSWGKSERLLDHCLEQASRANIFIGTYAFRYGWTPEKEICEKLKSKHSILKENNGYSVTQLERMCAKSTNSQLFQFIKKGKVNEEVVGKKFSDDKLKKLKKFRKELVSGSSNLKDSCGEWIECNENENSCQYEHIVQFKELADELLDKLFNMLISKEDTKKEINCMIHSATDRQVQMKELQNNVYLNGLFPGFKWDCYTKEFEQINKLLDHDLVSKSRQLFNRLCRDSEADDQKIKQPIYVPLTLTKKLSLNKKDPGGVLTIHGMSYCGKSSLCAALFSRLRCEVEASKFKRNTIFYWRYENKCDMYKQDCKVISLYDLLVDLIEYFMNNFFWMLLKPIRKQIEEFTKEIDTSLNQFWIPENIRMALLIWDCILTCLNLEYKVTVFLDGIDKLVDQSEISSMNWLPPILPNNLRFVIVVDTRSLIRQSLNLRSNSVEYQVVTIPLIAKKKVLVNMITQGGKVLDDSAYQNDYTQFCIKSDSNKPVYLNFAINYLNYFGNYLKISKQIRNLPSTISDLMKYCFGRLEKEISRPICAVYFSFLYLSIRGFRMEELQHFMGVYFTLVKQFSKGTPYYNDRYKSIISLDKFPGSNALFPSFPLIFINHASGIVYEDSHGKFHLKNLDVCKPILEKYVHESFIQTIFKCIASCLHMRINQSKTDKDAYCDVIHYLLQSNLYEEVVEKLTDLEFIKIKFDLQISDSLIMDYVNCERYLIEKNINSQFLDQILEFKRFVINNYYLFSCKSNLILQRAYTENPDSCIYQASVMYNKSSVDVFQDAIALIPDKTWHYDLTQPRNECIVNEVISCCCLYEIEDNNETDNNDIGDFICYGYIILGCQTGSIIICDLQSFQVQNRLNVHFNRVNTLCICYEKQISSATRLLSGDDTGLVCVWNLEDGALLKQLTKHTNSITGICYSSQTSFICTAGLDGQLILWNQNDYRISHVFKTSSPINCLALTGQNNKISAGCWNGDIVLYYLSPPERKAIIHQNISVRSISFNDSTKLFVTTDILGRCYERSVIDGHVIRTSHITNTLPSGGCVGDSISVKYLPNISTSIHYPGLNSAIESTKFRSKTGLTSNITSVFNKISNRRIGNRILEDVMCISVIDDFIFVGTSKGVINLFSLSTPIESDTYQSFQVSKSEIILIEKIINHDSKVVVVDYQGSIYILDYSSKNTCNLIMDNVHNGAKITCICTESNRIITGSDDCSIIFMKFDMNNFNCLRKHQESPFTMAVTCMQIFKSLYNEKYLLVGSKDGSIRIFDIITKLCMNKFETSFSITDLYICNKTIICGSRYEKKVLFYDIKYENKMILIESEKSKMITFEINISAFTDDILCLEDGTIVEFCLGGEITDCYKFLDEETNLPTQITFIQKCPNTKDLIMLDINNKLYRIDKNKNEFTRVILDHFGSVTDLVVGKNGQFCTVSQDGTLKLWNAIDCCEKKSTIQENDNKFDFNERRFVTDMIFITMDNLEFLVLYESTCILTIIEIFENSSKLFYSVSLTQFFDTNSQQNQDKKYLCHELSFESKNDIILIRLVKYTLKFEIRSKLCDVFHNYILEDFNKAIQIKNKLKLSFEFENYLYKIRVRNHERIVTVECLKDKCNVTKYTEIPLKQPIQCALLVKDSKYLWDPTLILASINGTLHTFKLLNCS